MFWIVAPLEYVQTACGGWRPMGLEYLGLTLFSSRTKLLKAFSHHSGKWAKRWLFLTQSFCTFALSLVSNQSLYCIAFLRGFFSGRYRIYCNLFAINKRGAPHYFSKTPFCHANTSAFGYLVYIDDAFVFIGNHTGTRHTGI